MKKLVIFLLLIFLSGCAWFFNYDDFNAGYRNCKKHNVYWHSQWGETHKCEWGGIVKDENEDIKRTTKDVEEERIRNDQ